MLAKVHVPVPDRWIDGAARIVVRQTTGGDGMLIIVKKYDVRSDVVLRQLFDTCPDGSRKRPSRDADTHPRKLCKRHGV